MDMMYRKISDPGKKQEIMGLIMSVHVMITRQNRNACATVTWFPKAWWKSASCLLGSEIAETFLSPGVPAHQRSDEANLGSLFLRGPETSSLTQAQRSLFPKQTWKICPNCPLDLPLTSQKDVWRREASARAFWFPRVFINKQRDVSWGVRLRLKMQACSSLSLSQLRRGVGVSCCGVQQDKWWRIRTVQSNPFTFGSKTSARGARCVSITATTG